MTNLDIIKNISYILNKEVDIKYVEDRLGHDKKYGLNSSKLKAYYRKKYDDFYIVDKTLLEYLEEMYGN
jgi:dTDP-D-glucose 4,6-dehydratase